MQGHTAREHGPLFERAQRLPQRRFERIGLFGEQVGRRERMANVAAIAYRPTGLNLPQAAIAFRAGKRRKMADLLRIFHLIEIKLADADFFAGTGKEIRISEFDLDEMENPEKVGHLSPLACPECNGSL